MPIKRRTPKSREHPIGPEAIAAYRDGDRDRLHRALGLKPWQSTPLDVASATRPPWFNSVDWALQRSLRAELEAACAR